MLEFLHRQLRHQERAIGLNFPLNSATTKGVFETLNTLSAVAWIGQTWIPFELKAEIPLMFNYIHISAH